MKLRCGPSEQKLIELKEAQDILDWQTDCKGEIIFAWFPIRIADDDCRWLENVKRVFTGDYYDWCYIKSRRWKYEALNGSEGA